MKSFIGHQGPVLACVLHENFLITSGHDQVINIWNLETNSLHHSFLAHDHIIEALDILHSPLNLYLLSASWDKSIRVWNITDFSLVHTLFGHSSRVRTVKALPAGNWIHDLAAPALSDQACAISGGDDCQLILWDVRRGYSIRSFIGHTHFILNIFIVGSDLPTVISHSSDMTIRFWNLENGEEYKAMRINVPGLTACTILSVEIQYVQMLSNSFSSSPNDRLSTKEMLTNDQRRNVLVFCDEEGSIFFYDLETSRPISRKSTQFALNSKIVAVHVLPDTDVSISQSFIIFGTGHDAFSIFLFTEDGQYHILNINSAYQISPMEFHLQYFQGMISTQSSPRKLQRINSTIPLPLNSSERYRSFLLSSHRKDNRTYLFAAGSEGGVYSLPVQFQKKPCVEFEAIESLIPKSFDSTKQSAVESSPISENSNRSMWSDIDGLGLSFARVKFNSTNSFRKKRSSSGTIFPSLVNSAESPQNDLNFPTPIFSQSKVKLRPLLKK